MSVNPCVYSLHPPIRKIKTTSPKQNQREAITVGRFGIWVARRRACPHFYFLLFLNKKKMFVLIMVQTKTRIIATSISLLDLYYVSEKNLMRHSFIGGFYIGTSTPHSYQFAHSSSNANQL